MIKHAYGVVIPCYNSEETVFDTLNSVFNQSIPPYHVVVVNDGSSDQTARIVTEFIQKHPNGTLISTTNKGLSEARNLGLKHLKDCEFISFVDSDDVWHLSKMESQIDFLEKHREIAGVTCDFIDFSGQDGILSGKKHRFYNSSKRTILLQSAKIWGSASAVVIRREALRDLNLFDINLKFAEDLDAWCTIREFGQWGYLSNQLVYIRSRPNSMQGKIRSNPSLYIESFNFIISKWSHELFQFELFLKRYDALFFTVRVWGILKWSSQLSSMRNNKTYSEIYPRTEKLPIYFQLLLIVLFGMMALVYRRAFRFLNWLDVTIKKGFQLE
jgi:glycosyltransferase involved in cell wall biosynthesis